MKAKLLLSILLVLLVGCETNEPSNTTSTVDESQNRFVALNLSIAGATQHPLKAKFACNYLDLEGLTVYTWDFGDGTPVETKTLLPTHRFPSKGSYTVTLTMRRKDVTKTATTRVTITEPTTCYVTGFTFMDVCETGKYHKGYITDDASLYYSTLAATEWVKLTDANVPYNYMFQTPKLLTKYSDKGYILWLKQNDTSSGNGTTICKWNLSKASIWLEFPEQRTAYASGSDLLRIYFKWE